jgi:2-phosphosulfolactate phosphatase
MRVVRESLLEGARRAHGIAVVIDVFRAFTVTPLLFHLGARKTIFVNEPEEAFLLKSHDPDVVLAGEVNEQLIPGFDLGNSPSEVLHKNDELVAGKVVVQRTTAGVTGVLGAMSKAEEVILGSYVMAKAVSRYILSRDPLPELVTLVAMGRRGMTRAPEDEGCADYVAHLLTGSPYDHLRALKTIIFNETAQKFIKRDKAYLPAEDPVLCLQKDLFDFVLIAQKEDGLVTIHKRELDD